jgi:diguanylate cyclase (GGDEF)-like protein
MKDASRTGRAAAAIAILALSAQVVTPFLFQRAIARKRAVITESLDAARGYSSDIRLATARQVAAIRGYLLSADTSLLIEYRAGRADQSRALSGLSGIASLDAETRGEVHRLAQATTDWNASNDAVADGRTSRSDAASRLDGQQRRYAAALSAGESLDQALDARIGGLRDEVGALERRWATASIALAVMAATAALLVVLMMRGSQRQAALARTDPLTGLFNRLGFDELARRELSRARRTEAPITLLSFDMDGFKQVNDQQGHAAGDKLLRTVGRAIRGTIRDTDVAARLGGDEFAILLPDNRGEPPVGAVERIRGAILSAVQGEHPQVTISMGAVTTIGHQIEVDEMIHMADTLMYRVKNEGKNGVRHDIVVASRPGAGPSQ